MPEDHADKLLEDLEKVKTAREFCKEWKVKWRAVAIAAQAILKFWYPAGAKVLQWLITLADTYCSAPAGGK